MSRQYELKKDEYLVSTDPSLLHVVLDEDTRKRFMQRHFKDVYQQKQD